MGTAVLDMEAAYNVAVRFPPTYTNFGGGQIGGETLGPGVHTFNTDVLISAGDLTFNGTAMDFFILQASKKVTLARNINVVLNGGALAENIFWCVGESFTVGAGSHLEGILLVKMEATFGAGSSLNGRILSQTRVDLDMATITQTPYVRIDNTRR
jgi:hypothetical protein